MQQRVYQYCFILEICKSAAFGQQNIYFNKLSVYLGTNQDRLSSVKLFDMNKKECRELKPLPYPVADMATVKWADNVVVIGGIDEHGNVLNTILIYNIKTGKSHMLPPMKYKRKGCTTAVLGNTIVAMGGADDQENILKSVEGFSFESYSWEEFPEMNDARYGATAVVI